MMYKIHLHQLYLSGVYIHDYIISVPLPQYPSKHNSELQMCEESDLAIVKPLYPSRWDSNTSCVGPRLGWLRPPYSRAADLPPASS